MTDKNILIEQVSNVIKYSQDLDPQVKMNGVPKIIDLWAKNKQFWLEEMGTEIYEFPDPVTFHLNDGGKRKLLDEFLDLISRCNMRCTDDLTNYLERISIDEFFNNKLENDYLCPTLNGDIVIPAGMKVIKSFKYFFDSENNMLNYWQDRASTLVQQDVVTGKLCFSVHPLDYLSISENAHNWRSCHALDGDYCTGNLNYMVDSSTVVCYLKSEHDAILPHFPGFIPWNSKKWRVLLYFSKDHKMFFAGRQYPFMSDEALKMVANYLFPRVGLSWPWFVTNKYYYNPVFNNPFDRIENLVPIGNSLIDLTSLVKNGENTYHYNDVLESSVYRTPYYGVQCLASTPQEWFDEENVYDKIYCYAQTSIEKTKFQVGRQCPCPICGDDNCVYPEASLVCNNCDDRKQDNLIECSSCGSLHYIEDCVWLPFSEEYVCSYCANDLPFCDNCGITDYEEYIEYDEATGKSLCPECRERLMKQQKENNNA